ncbi:hypothetical protein [Ktedonospora formicarum]|uniref:Uncharacterized protein n=1 Tax=Ktedonospora formicarum TaxID=2778364 RepID=A0A8J3MW13_9CHLR|nr:hypothetical protein [Ktedonospora formicarum]GHO48223.1 hypothetical protein KSX_63860 [Ktedonospora formicarum]
MGNFVDRIPRLAINIFAGIWIAGFFVAAVQQQGDKYLAPLGGVFDFSGGFWAWLARVMLLIPALSLFLLLVAFSFMTTEGANSWKDRVGATLLMILAHLALSGMVTGRYIALLPDWAVNFFGPLLGVGIAFLLYLSSQGLLSLSPNALNIFGGAWEAGFVVLALKAHGAGYFQPLSSLTDGGSILARITLAAAGMGTFIMFIIFSMRSVESSGTRMDKVKGTLGMMGMHLMFSTVPAFLMTKLTDWLPGGIGDFINASLAFALFVWAEVKRRNG